jgi:putative oxidoreductase
MSIAASPSLAVRPRGALHIALWVAQGLLAFAFGMAGVMKTTMPIAQLTQTMGWPGDLPVALVRFIGLAELAGAVGLILPAVTRIKPALTALAAAGLVVVMGLASIFHISRGELQALPINLTLGALAALVAWGRFSKVPIPARS